MEKVQFVNLNGEQLPPYQPDANLDQLPVQAARTMRASAHPHSAASWIRPAKPTT